MLRYLLGHGIVRFMKKRVRIMSPAKPGQLVAKWGRASREDLPDLSYAWGEGVPRADARMLDTAFTAQRMSRSFPTMEVVYEPSFLEELEARGYDISTLRFSIQKKIDPTQ
jgi:hypothetical protein